MQQHIRTFSSDEALVVQRRKQIIESAINLFTKKGYEETTVADLAQALGWSKGLLYHYVSNKDDVLYLVAHDQAEGTMRGFSALKERCETLMPTNAVLEYINYYYSVVHRSQDYQVFLNQLVAKLPKKDRKILFDADRFALDILDDIVKRGVVSSEFVVENTTLMAHNILLIGRVWADRRWFLQKHFTLEEYLKVQTAAILRMLGARPPVLDVQKEA
jgi:AcrR family transcriptional regulator